MTNEKPAVNAFDKTVQSTDSTLVNNSVVTYFLSIFILSFLYFVFNGSICHASPTGSQWVGTWATAPQLVEPHNMPPEPGLTDNTLRQIIRVSIGGDSLRVKFSNEFSNSPVTLKSVQIAVATGESSIDISTSKQLMFQGNTEVTMDAGGYITSDPIAFDLKSRMDLAITIYFGQTSATVTGHPGSRTTSYILAGNHVSANNFNDAIKTDHWYIINNIDVKAAEQAAAIAILGNSITDGRGSGTNKQNRWPDILSEQLLKNTATEQVAVLNLGIGGNCVLRQCLGPSAIDRFNRDVIRQQKVKWLIILEGVNDIGQTDSLSAEKVAADLIVAYKQMIDSAHARGIKVYGATILPIGKSFYYKPYHETARAQVNSWIRNGGMFDAVIDFDKLMQNPQDTESLLPEVHSGDFLHPNEEGYKRMGEGIDLKLFE